jgi:hypothetical protein
MLPFLAEASLNFAANFFLDIRDGTASGIEANRVCQEWHSAERRDLCPMAQEVPMFLVILKIVDVRTESVGQYHRALETKRYEYRSANNGEALGFIRESVLRFAFGRMMLRPLSRGASERLTILFSPPSEIECGNRHSCQL